MKISVVMVDGGFRENVYAAEYFSRQDFPDDDYEVIWVEYYDAANESVKIIDKVRVIELNKSGTYHSSYCFNAGINASKGEVIVIPDADQIVDKDFLKKVYSRHKGTGNLVCYGFRYDEMEPGALVTHHIDELKQKCKLKNPNNYGGCLTVRKELLLKINGYEQHEVFESGFHANGLDIYTRFKNLGIPVIWDRELVLYHPWHEHTLSDAREYELQKELINWRARNLQYMAFNGINKDKNSYDMHEQEIKKIIYLYNCSRESLLKRVARKINYALVGIKNKIHSVDAA